MKVIFLDIDGVLNSENHAKEMYAMMKEGKMTEKKFHKTWDLPYEGTLKPLKRIVDSTGAIIVLSSTWRIGGFKGILVNKLIKCFKPYDLVITDLTTTRGVSLEKLKELGFDSRDCYSICDYADGKPTDKYTDDRGAEIALWLSEHPDVESFVILDDDVADIDQYYKANHVWTDFYDWGLTEEKADKAIAVLNKEDFE